MNLTTKLTAQITKLPSPEWDVIRNNKIQQMVTLGKTDGIALQTGENFTYSRFFVDTESAQEFVDWVESTNSGYAINSVITEI